MGRIVKTLVMRDGSIALRLGSNYRFYEDGYLAAADYFDYMDRGIEYTDQDHGDESFTICKLLDGDWMILGA